MRFTLSYLMLACLPIILLISSLSQVEAIKLFRLGNRAFAVTSLRLQDWGRPDANILYKAGPERGISLNEKRENICGSETKCWSIDSSRLKELTDIRAGPQGSPGHWRLSAAKDINADSLLGHLQKLGWTPEPDLPKKKDGDKTPPTSRPNTPPTSPRPSTPPPGKKRLRRRFNIDAAAMQV